MKKHMQKLLAAIVVSLGLAGSAQAGIPSDALTVTIRPNAFYAVTISTIDVALDLGTVALSASTQTVVPATVTIQSTYASTDLTMQGVIASPGAGDWSFDSNTANDEANSLAAWATFTSVARTTAPAQGGEYFAGTVPGANDSDVVDGSVRYVGSSVGDGTTNLFENASGFDLVNMDGLAVNHQSHLWLNFRLPNASDDNDAQSVTFILTAVQPN